LSHIHGLLKILQRDQKMRVLNTASLELKEFPDLPDEPYTILSHRWGAEEVAYKEYRKNRDSIQHRAGYKKIVEFCHVSQQRGFRYAWVDTCCIDKRSSAELSEAINSMYRWYGESAECYIFLEDYVPDDPRSFSACEWFTRGWTLQELLAPTHCIFFTRTWEIIGHKHFWSCLRCPCVENKDMSTQLACGPNLLPQLATTTKIPEEILSGLKSVRLASVAQRMSWASRRSTTRVEDLAYSLLGLFEIHMPLLYGEGIRAFRRLQEEIIRYSDDTSIFCFDMERTTTLRDARTTERPLEYVRLLADTPSQFLQCNDVRRGIVKIREPYSVTQRSLSMVAAAYTRVRTVRDSYRIYAIPLGCGRQLQGIWETGLGIWEEIYLVAFQTHPNGSHVQVFALQGSTEDPIQFEGVDDKGWELTEPQLFHIRF
jgi:hypothetical protein